MNLGGRLSLGAIDAVEVAVADHDIVHLLQPGVLRHLTAVVLLLYGLSIGDAWRHLVALQHFEVRATFVSLVMCDRAAEVALFVPRNRTPS